MSDFDDYEESSDLGTVTLTLEDDTELECLIIAVFPAGENDYIALLPMTEGEPDEDAGVLIYRYIDHDDGTDPELMNIADEDEYDIAADAFDELQDEALFEEAEDEVESES